MAEVGANGALKNYLWGSDHAPLFQQDLATPSKAFFHPDHLGTTRGLTNQAGEGNQYAYSPFGALTDGDSSLTDYYFTGQHRDPATGLQYHRARWLNTNQGRWLSTDRVFDFPRNFGDNYRYAFKMMDIDGKQTLTENNIVLSNIGQLVRFMLAPSISMKIIMAKAVIGIVTQHIVAYMSVKQLLPLANEISTMAHLVAQMDISMLSRIMKMPTTHMEQLRDNLVQRLRAYEQQLRLSVFPDIYIAICAPILWQISAVALGITAWRFIKLIWLLELSDKYLDFAARMTGKGIIIKRKSIFEIGYGYMTLRLNPAQTVRLANMIIIAVQSGDMYAAGYLTYLLAENLKKYGVIEIVEAPPLNRLLGDWNDKKRINILIDEYKNGDIY